MGLFSNGIPRSAAVVIGALTAAGLTIVPVNSADAAATPAPSVSLRYDALLAPFPDGSLLADTAIAGGGVPSGGAALQGVTADGYPSWKVPYQEQQIIYPAPVVDGKGTYYWVDYTPASGNRIIASHAGSEVWSKRATDGGTPQNLVVGTDGNLYTLEPGPSGFTLNGYAAANGRRLFPAVPLTSLSIGGVVQVFAYDSGVIIATPSKVQYFDYAGRSVGGPYTLTASAIAFPAFAAQPDGRFFAAGMTAGIPFNGCSARGDNALLEKVTPAGVTWSRTLPWKSRCNAYGLVLNSMPDGGVVVSTATANGHGGYQEVNAAGKIGWYTQTKGPGITGGSLSPYPPQVDANGDIVAEGSFQYGCNLRSDYCAGVQINWFGPTGQPIGPPTVLSGSTTSNQVTWDVGLGGLALTPGIAYASLEFRQGGQTYGIPNYGVYSFKMSGLAAEYPQAALWNLMPGTGGCSDVLFLGARGSGESGPGTKGWKPPATGDVYGLGPQVYSAESQLATDLKGHVTVQANSLDYVADDVSVLFKGSAGIRQYFSDLSVGVDRAVAELGTVMAKCPSEQIVLSGYSQGAMVMHRVLRKLYSTTAGKKVISRAAAAVLIADGDQVPNDNDVTRYGTAPLDARGIGLAYRTVSHSSAEKFPSSLGLQVLSVCNTHDIVCAWTDLNLVKCGLNPSCYQRLVKIHEGYQGTPPVLAAADQAANDVLARSLHR
jgi:hypothetical protein